MLKYQKTFLYSLCKVLKYPLFPLKSQPKPRIHAPSEMQANAGPARILDIKQN